MRLTNDIRANIARRALANVPTVDYLKQLVPVLQAVLYEHMPPKVKAVYDDPESRVFLRSHEVRLRTGDGYSISTHLPAPVCGFTDKAVYTVDVQTDVRALDAWKAGTLKHDLTKAIIDSGLFAAHIKQQELLKSVKNRLEANLSSVTTVKRLYDVLEPELHHLIPKEPEKIKAAGLPACVAPVVADLKALGAVLPDVPKAEEV